MSGFDAVYNEQCAKLWNPDPSTPIQFKVSRMMYSTTWDVLAYRDGLGIGVGNGFTTKEEAQTEADRLQQEYDNAPSN